MQDCKNTTVKWSGAGSEYLSEISVFSCRSVVCGKLAHTGHSNTCACADILNLIARSPPHVFVTPPRVGAPACLEALAAVRWTREF